MSDITWRLHSLIGTETGLECEICGSTWKHSPHSLCPGIRIYWDGWDNWPDGLLTKSQLSAAGYTIGKKLPSPAGLIPRTDSPDGFMRLYDPATATPKREMTVGQVMALVKAWEANEQRNRCPECGRYLFGREWYKRICEDCEIKEAHEAAKDECRAWARRQLEQGFIVIDFETTGLDYGAEPVEVGIVDHLGNVLINTLVKPECEVSEGARRVHGISDEQLASAPTWGDVYPDVYQALQGQTAFYYAMDGFDRGIFEYACRMYRLPLPAVKWESVMPYWNAWCGNWHRYFEDWRWQALNGNHDAVSDADLVRCLVMEMAGLP